MQINVHPMLAAQQAILDLSPAERPAALRRMLAPFEPMIKLIVPQGRDPLAMFCLMRPDGSEAAYREALARLAAAGAEETCRAALERAAAAMAATGYTAPIKEIQFGLFLLDANPAMMDLSQGYTGFGGIPGYIMVNLWPDERNLPKLGACTAHEFNHQIRNCVEPFRMDISVGQYIIMEGLAESFAAELYGPDAVGPWVSEVTGADLAQARRTLGGALGVKGFNQVRPYIFGDQVMAAFSGSQPVGVPAYAGYTAGFHAVQAYLRKTGKTAAEATLIPSEVILQEGAYFA